MRSKIVALVVFNFDRNGQTINFLQIFAVTFPKGMQFVFILVFLACKTFIAIALNAKLMVEPLDVSVTIRNNRPLAIELSVKLGVLLSAFVVETALFINVRPQSLDESYVAIDTALVVFIHAPLFLV